MYILLYYLSHPNIRGDTWCTHNNNLHILPHSLPKLGIPCDLKPLHSYVIVWWYQFEAKFTQNDQEYGVLSEMHIAEFESYCAREAGWVKDGEVVGEEEPVRVGEKDEH